MGETLNPDPNEEFRKRAEHDSRYNKNKDKVRYGENEPRWELGALDKLNYYIEHDSLPEKKELVSDFRKASIDLIDPLMQLQIDARTRFNFNDYSVVRLAEIADGYSRDFQQAVQHVDRFEDLGSPATSGLAKLQNINLVRIGAFHKLENHTIGFKNFYFDAKGAFSLLATGRRHGAINTGDWISMFSPLPELELNNSEKDALKILEGNFTGEEVSKMTAQIEHFDRAVGAMNRYNPTRTGKEMFMEVSETEQKFLAELFTVPLEPRGIDEEDDKWNKRSNPNNVDYKPEHTTKVEVNGKKFYTNLLSWYVSAHPESDRRKYEATMKALVEVDALGVLKTLPRVLDHLVDENKTRFDELVIKVNETRDRILGNWNSLVKPFRSRLADFAYEQNFNLQTGTQNIAELSYRFKWEKKNNVWDFTVEIPGPETGQDAVNGRNPFVHELTYKVLKGRGVTNMMPWPKAESVNEMIKIALMETQGKDPKPIILADPGLAKGAAIIGLYPNEAESKLDDKDLKDVIYARSKLKFNEKALKVLDSILWIYDLSAENSYLPMPIKPMYDSFNMYKVMKDPVTGKTVHETLSQEGKTLQDVDFSNMVWHAGDDWEVNMKMIEDVLQMMYGRQDPKYLDSFLQDKVGGIGEMIKKMDIGTRSEDWKVEVRKSLDPRDVEYNVKKEVKVEKGFIEIMQISYLIVTYTALKKWRIWDEGGWDEGNQREYWEDIQEWAKIAISEPSKKGDFENYNDTLVLMIYALAEWYTNPAKKYNDEANRLTYTYNSIIPSKPESYVMPTIKSDKK